MIYFDACYLGKMYLSEPDTPQVRAAAASVGAVACSIHGQLEVIAIFHRKLRKGNLSAAAFQATCRQFELDCASGLWKWLAADSRIFHRAKNSFLTLPATQFLRASDAHHLACAAEHGFKDIHTSDKHMIAAAPHFGLNAIKL